MLATFDCESFAMRLLRLGPGPGARAPRPPDRHENGEVRLHVRVLTSPLTEFGQDGQRVPMVPVSA